MCLTVVSIWLNTLIIDEYKINGFQANQDIPGNFLWEELYNASPKAKVILTVRDSKEQFKTSWTKFMEKILSNTGNPGHWIVRKIADFKLMGPKFHMMEDISKFHTL